MTRRTFTAAAALGLLVGVLWRARDVGRIERETARARTAFKG